MGIEAKTPEWYEGVLLRIDRYFNPETEVIAGGIQIKFLP
jgi:hypothetical protein